MIALRCFAQDGAFVTEGTNYPTIEAAWERSHDMGSRWIFYPIHVVTAKRRILSVPTGVPDSWVNRWTDTFVRALQWELANNEEWYINWLNGKAPSPIKDPDAYKFDNHPPVLPGLRPEAAVARSQEWVDATWLHEARCFLRLIARHSTYGEGEGELHPGQNDNLEDCARVMNHHILKARELMENLLPPITNLPSTCRLALQLGSSPNIFRFFADVLEHGNHHKLCEWVTGMEDLLRAGVDLKLTIPHAPWYCPQCGKLLRMDVTTDEATCTPCGTVTPLFKLRYLRDNPDAPENQKAAKPAGH